ncbi:hypothetical protein BV20DRAFT_917761, partial [Pilatotrama ljubarskyi]
MKDPALEKKLLDIEASEKKRRVRAAIILNKRKLKQNNSRTAVMKRMISRTRQ